MRYNEAVRDYNVMVKRFPTNLVARITGFSQRAYFEAAPSAQQVPQVDFGTKSSGTAPAPAPSPGTAPARAY